MVSISGTRQTLTHGGQLREGDTYPGRSPHTYLGMTALYPYHAQPKAAAGVTQSHPKVYLWPFPCQSTLECVMSRHLFSPPGTEDYTAHPASYVPRFRIRNVASTSMNTTIQTCTPIFSLSLTLSTPPFLEYCPAPRSLPASRW